MEEKKTIVGTAFNGKAKSFRVKSDSAQSGSVRPGALVAGRYLVEREIGRGGMGRVFVAEDRNNETIHSRKRVVLKILAGSGNADDAMRRRFESEANLLAGMSNDGIASCYDALMLSDGMPVLVMEYIDGKPLDEYIRDCGGRLGEDDCRELLLPIAGALDYAHEHGVFHLDVKPQNIMVRKTRSNGAATCLIDFGIATATGQDSVGGTYGTRQYMPPESGDDPSAAMDVYSLAVTAYECLMGEVPYPDGWRMNASVRPLPEETPFSCAVMRGLSEFPEDRPASCMELVEPDLEELGRKTGTSPTRPRRRRFPPPPVENLRLSPRSAANGAIKVEWDWPDDLETCMWAVVEAPVEKLEDIPEANRKWISRKTYGNYGGVSVQACKYGPETRFVAVFGVYVLARANRTFASKECRSISLAVTEISYSMEIPHVLSRLLRKRGPVLIVRSSGKIIPELKVVAYGWDGERPLMTIEAREECSELVVELSPVLRKGESVGLKLPRGADGSFKISRQFSSDK